MNGATKSVVGKGRDEQRVPFSNLLDDIGRQELQSSEEFLLCQLRQPSSRDASAQLFGVARTRSKLMTKESRSLDIEFLDAEASFGVRLRLQARLGGESTARLWIARHS